MSVHKKTTLRCRNPALLNVYNLIDDDLSSFLYIEALDLTLSDSPFMLKCDGLLNIIMNEIGLVLKDI